MSNEKLDRQPWWTKEQAVKALLALANRTGKNAEMCFRGLKVVVKPGDNESVVLNEIEEGLKQIIRGKREPELDEYC